MEKPRQFEHVSGRKTELHITNKEHLFSGGMSSVFLVSTEQHGKKRTYVLKEYSNKQRTEKAFDNYKILKEAGLKTFPTFRLETNGTNLLMTTANTKEFVCVSSNYKIDSTVESFGANIIKNLKNADQLFRSVFEEAQKAYHAKIWIDSDAFLFIIPRENAEVVDFVIGDTDLLHKFKEHDKSEASENFFSAREALKSFVEHNIENPENYLKRIDELYKEFMDKEDAPYIHRLN